MIFGAPGRPANDQGSGTPSQPALARRGFPFAAALLSLRRFSKGIVRAVPHQMSRVRQQYFEGGTTGVNQLNLVAD
jgi:hypothetical protein